MILRRDSRTWSRFGSALTRRRRGRDSVTGQNGPQMKEFVSGNLGVQILGRAGLRYREGARSVSVDGEMGGGPVDFIVYVNTIAIWEQKKERIDSAERLRIVENIRRVLEENGLIVKFE
jgi:hypothetical protein